MRNPINWPGLDDFLRAALREDLEAGDITTEATIAADRGAWMGWTVKSPLVAAGLFAGVRVFELLDPSVRLIHMAEEGAAAEPGARILELEGNARALLSGERVALNVCQRLCGTATLTAAYVKAVAGTGAKIAATRKTTPLLRRLEKYAVTVGGGTPHRYGLSDGVLIKDNHIDVAGGIAKAVAAARSHVHHLVKIEVEVRNLDEVKQALEAKADILLLDNMDLETMRAAVELAKGRALTEASGNMTIARAAEAARTGVNYISVGALTHSAPAADISARAEIIS